MKLTSLLGFLMLLGACAAGSEDEGGGGPADGGSPATGGAPGSGGNNFGGFNDGGGYMPEPEVFGHSRTTLFKLNPTTKDVGIVDTFKECSNIEDIALDKDSNL